MANWRHRNSFPVALQGVSGGYLLQGGPDKERSRIYGPACRRGGLDVITADGAAIRATQVITPICTGPPAAPVRAFYRHLVLPEAVIEAGLAGTSVYVYPFDLADGLYLSRAGQQVDLGSGAQSLPPR